jgi:hypothetical protein
MKSILTSAIALLLLVSYGIAEGLWTDRWHFSDTLERATARLSQVPRTFGAWQGQDEEELDPRQVAQAEMSGYVRRRYVNRQNGAEVSVLLVCGRPGPTAVHSPEVCYAGSGFTATQAPTIYEVTASGSASCTLWVGQFLRNGPTPEPLRIYWAWSANGAWQAADNPRVQLAHLPALYKLYVVRLLPRLDEPIAEDPCGEFLREFLPEIQTALSAK